MSISSWVTNPNPHSNQKKNYRRTEIARHSNYVVLCVTMYLSIKVWTRQEQTKDIMADDWGWKMAWICLLLMSVCVCGSCCLRKTHTHTHTHSHSHKDLAEQEVSERRIHNKGILTNHHCVIFWLISSGRTHGSQMAAFFILVEIDQASSQNITHHWKGL